MWLGKAEMSLGITNVLLLSNFAKSEEQDYEI
ncbi:hypothetical protein QFZ77_001651 [Paenibacillus sp. V4I3]|nr:hypothetical protein [Paenibacillus sp. V4I3]MDQ0891090.1 hypothetical protein [Paenibacillus sp. V4I9]